MKNKKEKIVVILTQYVLHVKNLHVMNVIVFFQNMNVAVIVYDEKKCI
jgi:hypothetical protein